MTTPLKVFVAMPGTTLGEHANWSNIDEIREHLYDQLAALLEQELGRKVEVVVEKEKDTVGLIHNSMFAEAMDAEVYIADLTGANPNVYLELGVRWALRDHVTVPVCQSVEHDVKFNVGANRVIPYGKNPGELRTALQKIVSAITKGLLQQKVDSPVRAGANIATVARTELDELRAQIAELTRARGNDLFNEAMSAPPSQRVAKLRRVLEINDTRADVHGELGKALRDAGDIPAAIAHLSHATKLDKENAEWWRALGIAQSRRGEYASAVDSLSEAVRLDPADADAYSSLGGAHRRIARDTGDSAELRKARDCYQRASEIRPGELYSLANVARLEVLLAGDPGARAAAVEKFSKLNPLAWWLTDDKDVDWEWLDLADTFAFRGDTEEALKALRKGLAQFPADNRASTAKIAVETVQDMLDVGWLPESVAGSLRALVTEYEKWAT